jgi:protein maelstrom
LKHLKFYFFSTSYFVQTLNGDIFPAEIALSTFSLIDGVDDVLHFLVNPGPLPLGMASEAKTHSEETHRLPPPPNIEGEDSYDTMFSDIMEFLVGRDGKRSIPPIFVEPGMKDEDIKAAKLTLEKIVKKGGQGRNIVFRVYPMEQMLYRLNKKCVEARNAESRSFVKAFNSAIMAKDMMSRDEFMYADIGCQFHRKEDANNHCCLSKVKRWGYMISRLCLDIESDPMICGRHLPVSFILSSKFSTKTTFFFFTGESFRIERR